jgi:hypothetical protein
MASGLRPGTVDRGRLPVQQRDRRAALSALALLLVVAGALGSALVVYRSGHRTDVLVAAHEIKPGQLMSAEDFTTARVANDSGATIPATSRLHFIGTYSTVDVPAGTLLNRLMFVTGAVLPPDGVVVGLVLPSTHRPAVAIKAGDVVRVYLVRKNADAPAGTATTPAGATPAPTVAASGSVLVASARVVEAPAATSGDSVSISLLLKATDAQAVVVDAASQEIAVARLPVGTVPGIDMQHVDSAGAVTAPQGAATTGAPASPSR